MFKRRGLQNLDQLVVMDPSYKSMDGSQRNGQVSLSPSDEGRASYTNQPVTDYLTPTSPVPDLPPQIPAFPAGFNRSLSHPVAPDSLRLTHPTGQQLPRADSGIESDYPRSPMSSTGSNNPRTSTVYEYIDPKDVKLDSGPGHSNSRPLPVVHGGQGDSNSSGMSNNSTTTTTTTARSAVYTGDMMSDSEDGFVLDESSRRRVNPMYEALEKSATRLYAQTCRCQNQKSTQKQMRYLWCAFSVALMLAIFCLAVIAYLLFMLIPGMQGHIHEGQDRLKVLESRYAELSQQQVWLPKADNGSSGGIQVNSTALNMSLVQVLDRVTQLNGSLMAVNSQLQDFNLNLQKQIQNISLTPGPQGPPGVGDFGLCYYHTMRSSVILPSSTNTVSWQPSVEVLDTHMVMSAACDVVGGTEQSVEVNQLSNQKIQYRCRCRGQLTDLTTTRVCQIHMVLCPLPAA